MEINILESIAKKKFTKENTSKLSFLDEVQSRLNKLEKERRYYARFMCGKFYISKIKAHIKILRDRTYETVSEEHIILEETGYPFVDKSCADLSNLANKINVTE